MDKTQLLENYAKRLGSKGKTRNLYLNCAGEFLDFSEGKFDRETIEKYLDHLRRKHHYHDGSINFCFRVVRTLFRRNEFLLVKEGIEWPFNRGESPQIREDDIQAPALDPDIIGEMIEATKQRGEPSEQAFLAISTIYFTRRIEMVELAQDDVNLRGKTIHIATAKNGRERTHLIPDEIVPYLKGYDFDTGITENGLFTMWYRLEYLIGLEHTDQVGWHSVRRTGNTLLLDHLPESVVMSFFRWKQMTSSHMPFRYSAQRFVGREGVTTKVIGEAKDVDTKVFEVHPFLKYWRRENP